jgi:hypothetical protein
MNSIFIGVRGLGLTLLILVAIGHADLQASVAGWDGSAAIWFVANAAKQPRASGEAILKT